MTTKTKTQPSATSGTGNALKRHLVELDAKGQPLDTCLCGHVWDRVFLEHGDEICQACADESKRRKWQ